MFDAKEEIGEAVEAVYALTADLARGDVLTHAAVRAVLGVDPHTGPWGHVMRKVRRRLERDRGVATWPETTVGYKLLTAAEQLELPARRARRGLRQVRRGRASVDALPEKSLTLHQRRVRAFLSERGKEAERALRREIRAAGEALRPTPTLPRRPAPVA